MAGLLLVTVPVFREVAVGVGLGEGVAVAVAVGVGVRVAVGVEVGVAVAVGVDVAVGVEVAVPNTATAWPDRRCTTTTKPTAAATQTATANRRNVSASRTERAAQPAGVRRIIVGPPGRMASGKVVGLAITALLWLAPARRPLQIRSSGVICPRLCALQPNLSSSLCQSVLGHRALPPAQIAGAGCLHRRPLPKLPIPHPDPKRRRSSYRRPTRRASRRCRVRQ